jgi:hypothetical protein
MNQNDVKLKQKMVNGNVKGPNEPKHDQIEPENIYGLSARCAFGGDGLKMYCLYFGRRQFENASFVFLAAAI